jgi:hypothetical protein
LPGGHVVLCVDAHLVETAVAYVDVVEAAVE